MRRHGLNGEIRRFFCRPLFDRRCWYGRTRASYSRRFSCVEHVSWTKHAFFCIPPFLTPTSLWLPRHSPSLSFIRVHVRPSTDQPHPYCATSHISSAWRTKATQHHSRHGAVPRQLFRDLAPREGQRGRGPGAWEHTLDQLFCSVYSHTHALIYLHTCPDAPLDLNDVKHRSDVPVVRPLTPVLHHIDTRPVAICRGAGTPCVHHARVG
jgi:hypothetical protein